MSSYQNEASKDTFLSFFRYLVNYMFEVFLFILLDTDFVQIWGLNCVINI